MSDTIDQFLTKSGELGRTPGYAPPGFVIMERVAGSRSFNCHREDSDWDWAGVYVAPLRDLIGLNPPKSESWKLETPNCQYHEVRRFAEMLAEGTPAALESAFCEKMMTTTPPWEKLRLIREKFVTRQAVVKYIRYGEGQLKKYLAGKPVHSKGGKPGEKWLYHVARLAKQAFYLANGQMPQNWQDQPSRDFLMLIRDGTMPEDEVVRHSREMFDHARRLEPYPLPEQPDMAALNEWVLETRELQWLCKIRGLKELLSLR